MTYLATLTQKGQITLPKELRALLGLEPYGTVKLKKNKSGRVEILATEDIVEKAGFLKGTKPQISKSSLKKHPPGQEREYMQNNYQRA